MKPDFSIVLERLDDAANDLQSIIEGLRFSDKEVPKKVVSILSSVNYCWGYIKAIQDQPNEPTPPIWEMSPGMFIA